MLPLRKVQLLQKGGGGDGFIAVFGKKKHSKNIKHSNLLQRVMHFIRPERSSEMNYCKTRQALARSLFWVSRRDRELSVSFLETRTRFCPPNLEPRDEIENFFTESRASRRDREFCSPNLEIRDEIEIFRSFYQNIFLSQKERFFP